MRRILIGILGVLICTPAAWALDEPTDSPRAGAGADSPRARFEALQKEYTQAQQEFSDAYRQATTADERQKVYEAKYPDLQKYAPRMIELAESAPGDPVAVDALIWVVENGGQAREADRAVELLARDHARDSKVVQISSRLVYSRSPAAETLLRAVAESNPDRAAQGQATFALARYLKFQAGLVRNMKQYPELVTRLEPAYGQEFTRTLQEKDPDALAGEAESLFETVAEKFGDLSHYRGDLTKAARAELFGIRNLGIGKTAPEIEGEDLDGHAMKLSDYKGKVVVLDFWGDWCGPCRAMYPHERSLVRRLEGKPFALVGINSDRDKPKLKGRMEEEHITWPWWWDGGSTTGPIATAWNVHAWPTIYVLDDKGVIRYKGVRGAALDRAVNTLLKEMGVDVVIGDRSESK